MLTSWYFIYKQATVYQNYSQEKFYRDVLLRFVLDICDVIDSGPVTLLSLLGVSTTFDTVDNDIVKDVCLRISYRIAVRCLDCLQCSLLDRQTMVIIGSDCTAWTPLPLDFQRGLIFGPILYIF